MLKALYDFKATFAKTLSFQQDEHFILLQRNIKQKNWWQVVNKKGQLGYIPSNYVKPVKVCMLNLSMKTVYKHCLYTYNIFSLMCNQVQSQFFIEFLEDCIVNLEADINTQGDSLHSDKQDLLSKLIEKKRQVELNKKSKRQAPEPPEVECNVKSKETHSTTIRDNVNDVKSTSSNISNTITQTTLRGNTNVDAVQTIVSCQRPNGNESHKLPRQSSSDIVQKVQLITDVRKSVSQGNIQNLCTGLPTKNSTPIPAINSRSAYQLLDQVRKNTQLSYEMSKVAVTVVISGLRQLLPETVGHHFDALLHELQTPLTVSKMSIEETYDANRLKIIFTELTSCKEDSQQRSWMLYEDESIIMEYIKELTEILVYFFDLMTT